MITKNMSLQTSGFLKNHHFSRKFDVETYFDYENKRNDKIQQENYLLIRINGFTP